MAVPIPGTLRLLHASAFDLDHAKRAGKFIYAIEYDLIHDIERRGQTPLDVLNHLMKLDFAPALAIPK